MQPLDVQSIERALQEQIAEAAAARRAGKYFNEPSPRTQ
jgi:hypothetical protein